MRFRVVDAHTVAATSRRSGGPRAVAKQFEGPCPEDSCSNGPDASSVDSTAESDLADDLEGHDEDAVGGDNDGDVGADLADDDVDDALCGEKGAPRAG